MMSIKQLLSSFIVSLVAAILTSTACAETALVEVGGEKINVNVPVGYSDARSFQKATQEGEAITPKNKRLLLVLVTASAAKRLKAGSVGGEVDTLIVQTQRANEQKTHSDSDFLKAKQQFKAAFANVVASDSLLASDKVNAYLQSIVQSNNTATNIRVQDNFPLGILTESDNAVTLGIVNRVVVTVGDGQAYTSNAVTLSLVNIRGKVLWLKASTSPKTVADIDALKMMSISWVRDTLAAN